ncbi:phage late control D family protein [Actinobacillus porcinus]|uniref:phage late control D family protein n=1 Tax=Actinobacillus porcinus TaxID=51048 RepID=UPI0023537F68|nr:phage late control D family protein [Actinobacillus porcinus]MCI5763127.1 phage late control D family protein [Actinobacillus porcinus]MDY5421188.1 phage late control D family protein [Actinobacillus porcinus]
MLEDFFQTNHRTPLFNVRVITKDKQEKDITQIVNGRLISLSIADNRGFEADMLELELSDHDGLLELPPRNATIQVAIGWHRSLLVDKGKYLVDEVQFSGAPDKVNIRARSADLKGSLSEKKERSFDKIKLTALVEQLAKENQLQANVSESYSHITIPHIDQTSESDINLLTRLAEQYDAIATVKNGTLLFMPTGKGKTASGAAIPPFEITRQIGDSYNFSIAESDNYKAVRAYWHNTDTGKRGEVIIDENSKITKKQKMTKGRKLKNGDVKGQRLSKRKYTVLEQTEPVTSDSDQIKTLRHTYASEQSAITGAKSAFDKLKRGVATFSITLAYGEPELMPEMPLVLRGFKSMIDGSDWIISRVTHNINDSGYTTQVECELKVETDDVEVKKKEQ